MELPRRSILAALGATALAVPGLAWLTRPRPRPSELAELEVVNYDDRPHTVELRVSDGDEAVYERSVELAAAPSEVPPGDPTHEDLTDYPADPGTYTVRAWLDGAPDGDRGSFDVGEYDAPCIGLRVHVGGPERSDADVSIWHTTDADGC